MISDELKDILDSDDGLLDSPIQSSLKTNEDRLLESFEEINRFYEEYNRQPSTLTDDVNERKLASRLNGMRENSKKRSELLSVDRYNLLEYQPSPESVQDIFENDDMGLLENDSEILTVKNVPTNINKPDYIGRQKRCEDFEHFEPMFKSVHVDLAENKRKIIAFSHQKEIVAGNFFVLRGLIVYVDKVGERTVSVNGLEDARLRLIYENGTESDILLLSFAKALFLDGRLITAHDDHLIDPLKGIESNDIESGYIYILSSMSSDQRIAQMHNLYKIGFSTQSVAARIKGAESDPTYLMAPVKVVATYKCFNMTTHKFEQLLHRIFSRVRLDMQVTNLNNRRHDPTEWFVVPLDVIDQAISLIISDDIINYEYDDIAQKLVSRHIT